MLRGVDRDLVDLVGLPLGHRIQQERKPADHVFLNWKRFQVLGSLYPRISIDSVRLLAPTPLNPFARSVSSLARLPIGLHKQGADETFDPACACITIAPVTWIFACEFAGQETKTAAELSGIQSCGRLLLRTLPACPAEGQTEVSQEQSLVPRLPAFHVAASDRLKQITTAACPDCTIDLVVSPNLQQLTRFNDSMTPTTGASAPTATLVVMWFRRLQ